MSDREIDSDGFTKFDGRNQQADAPAEIRVRPGSAQAYVTVGAVNEYFTRRRKPVETVAYHTNADQSFLAIERDPDDDDTFSVSVKESGGGITLGSVLKKAFGADVDDLDEPHALDIERDSDLGMLVVDVAPVVEDATGAVHCDECGKRCETSRGLKSHVSKMHDGIRAKIKNGEISLGGPDHPDGDDSWKDVDERARSDGGDA